MKSTEDETSRKKVRYGLAATLFAWFILLSLTPITIIGIYEYREGKRTIVDSSYKELTTINLLLSEQINDYFDSVVTNLFIKAGVAQNFLEDLKADYQTSELELSEFAYSSKHHMKYDKYFREFVDFLRFYDYSDIILADTDGNILYTVNGYSDLGQNLYEGELAGTSFSRAVKSSIGNAEPRYADVGLYPPLNGQPVSFIILPLVNSHEEIEGILAVQIMAYSVQSIFENDNQFIEGLKSYLVGTDGLVRYGTELSSEQSMQIRMDNLLVNDWLSHLDAETGEYIEKPEHIEAGIHHHHHDDDELFKESVEFGDFSLDLEDSDYSGETKNRQTMQAHIQSYENVYQEQVLGTFYPVNVAGVPLMMISEIREADAFASVTRFRDRLLFTTGITILLVLFTAVLVTRRLVKPIRTITAWANRVAQGEYDHVEVISGHNEISELSRSFSEMTNQLRRVIGENERKSWLQDGQAGLNDSMRGEQDLAELSWNIVTYLAKYLNMQTGAMYVIDDDKQLKLMGTYAWSLSTNISKSFGLGEGIVGQAALEQQPIELSDIPDDYMVIESGLGSTSPKAAIIIPLVYEEEVKGVFEFALLKPLDEQQKLFLEESVEKVAIAINSAQYRTRVNDLLVKTTKQSEVLKEQQEELKSVNDELENRARVLEESREELQAQSEEMQRSNVELEEKTEILQQQKAEIERKNLDIELSRKVLEEKARELEQASKYKSEFLANMSHELRTPLNSLLLLAQMLADNDEGNLTDDQVESVEVIYNGGKELLELINDILDLSKVEAGKMGINLEEIDLEELCSSARTLFRPLADDRGLDFSVEIKKGTTRNILTDSQRLMQIIKNFLSNAFKFTESGGVYINVENFTEKTNRGEQTYVAFHVRDTGIGIAKEKQAAIFEAFQQADGSTSRKYGGTGLGLAISREMSNLLGGFIGLESEEGVGTTFTLYLPDNAVCSLDGEKVFADSFSEEVSHGISGYSQVPLPKPEKKKDKSENEPKPPSSEIPESAAAALPPECNSLLFIEDDTHFSGILCQIAHNHHFECLHAYTGQDGLKMAREQKPKAIILDLGLPDMDGRKVLEQLKNDGSTHDIPVHIISGEDKDDHREAEVIGFLTKPVTVADLDKAFMTVTKAISTEIKHVLLLDPDLKSRDNLKTLMDKKGFNIGEAETAAEAMTLLGEENWQCVVMEVDLPDATGLEFLRQLHEKYKDKMPSIVIHTHKQLNRQEYDELQQYSNTMVVKGDRASERVTDEVSLFMHSIEKKAKKGASETGEAVELREKSLDGHKILLVDDDLRNSFALSKGLQSLGLEIVIADNGQNALDKLEEEEGIELVLMDIMMPVMDGYEATRAMRTMPELKDLPVIALTAKAMSDDKAKCIEAGANDYMTKPVDLEKLVEMMKVWLFK